MKFISWNVNGLRAAMKKGFADFFNEQDADFFALQETKMQPEQLEDAMKFDGYHMYMNSAERKGYSGTLIYTKHEPLSVTYE
ncbi:MAG: exodeoxyribonuclease III, partial [Solobacterium sp.]|nr:exodeoxyribonuclease III [Solobacterium sp.]